MSDKELLTQQEKMEFVKFSRYNEVASDNIASVLLDLTEKLENIGFLSDKRPSKQIRDKKLRSILLQHRQSSMDVFEMMNFIPGHPDSEKLVNSLFQDLNVPRFIPRKTLDKASLLNSVQNNLNRAAESIEKTAPQDKQHEKSNVDLQQAQMQLFLKFQMAQQAQQQAKAQQQQVQQLQQPQNQQQLQTAQQLQQPQNQQQLQTAQQLQQQIQTQEQQSQQQIQEQSPQQQLQSQPQTQESQQFQQQSQIQQPQQQLQTESQAQQIQQQLPEQPQAQEPQQQEQTPMLQQAQQPQQQLQEQSQQQEQISHQPQSQ